MDQGPAHRRLANRGVADQGVSSVQFVLASTLSLIVFLAFANLAVVQYGRGAIRSALDQGARAGAMTGSAETCVATANDVVEQLLGGRMGDSVAITCAPEGGLMTARAKAVFESWTPLTADFGVSVSGEAAMEP